MTEIIRCTRDNLAARLKAVDDWDVPAAVQAEVRRFVADLALGRVNVGRRLSERRQIKYLFLLRVPLACFNKPSNRLVLADIERFERALVTDSVRRPSDDQPYSSSTKADIRKALKVFIRWRLGEAKAVTLVGWLDTRVPARTPDYLKESEVEALYQACNTPQQRFLIAVLFDAGARAQEFLNLRFEDVQLPEGNQNFVRLTLKEEYSKTKGRTVSLYWRHSHEAVADQIKARRGAAIPVPSDPVFDGTYGSLRMFLARLGRRVLGRSIHPHLFRHSSATFYATRLNRQELCYRYGWRFSSNMPDVYISRAGMENRDLDDRFTATEMGQLKEELAAVRRTAQSKEDTIQHLSEEVARLQGQFANVARILERKPGIRDLERAIKRKKAGR